MRRHANLGNQKGVVLIEALISILVFSLGLLTLVALQAVSIQRVSDAKYRSDAAALANQIIGKMWSDPANLAAYNLNAGGADCAGAAPAGTLPTADWARQVAAALPGTAGGGKQKIEVNAATGEVLVTICWRSLQDTSDHMHVVASNIGINP